jgi:hypothetical protein
MEFEEESRARDGSEELEITQTDISLGSHSQLSMNIDKFGAWLI